MDGQLRRRDCWNFVFFGYFSLFIFLSFLHLDLFSISFFVVVEEIVNFVKEDVLLFLAHAFFYPVLELKEILLIFLVHCLRFTFIFQNIDETRHSFAE